jgi:amidase/6-aminohexanoate-cyclic-dimer hydrolase
MPLANVTGAPSISLPLAWTADGLPIGMAFTARFADEAMLLRIAAQLEAATPWFDRRPPLAIGSR